MKNSILYLSAFALITVTVISGCDSPAQRVTNAKNNVTDAKNNLDLANQDYMIDMENFRKKTADKIAANDKSIAEFKKNTVLKNKETNHDNVQQLAELEKRNHDLKQRMDDYNGTGKDNWETFKTQFNQDMDDFGKNFNELINTKNK